LLEGLLGLGLGDLGHRHAELEIEVFGTVGFGPETIALRWDCFRGFRFRGAVGGLLIVDGFGRVHLSSSLRDL
jgi:hypothetical protein